MSNELIKAVREAVIRSGTNTRDHSIMRHGYEPIVMRGRLSDCIKTIIHATRRLIESGHNPNDFDKYLKFVSYEYYHEYHLYVFDKLPLFL